MERKEKVNERKTSRGRQRIEIKKIEKETARQVAFTKRRQGVMKKASELAALCGAEVVIVTISLAGKPFSFGHPSVEAVVDRFLSRGRKSVEGKEPGDRTMAEWLSLKCVEAERRVMEAKAKRAAWIADKDVTQLEGLGVEELEKARKLMVEAKQRVKMRQMELLFADAAIPINMLSWNTNACGSTVGELEVENWEGGGLVMTSAKTDEEMLMRYPFSAKTDEEMLMRYPFSAAATGANLI